MGDGQATRQREEKLQRRQRERQKLQATRETLRRLLAITRRCRTGEEFARALTALWAQDTVSAAIRGGERARPPAPPVPMRGVPSPAIPRALRPPVRRPAPGPPAPTAPSSPGLRLRMGPAPARVPDLPLRPCVPWRRCRRGSGLPSCSAGSASWCPLR